MWRIGCRGIWQQIHCSCSSAWLHFSQHLKHSTNASRHRSLPYLEISHEVADAVATGCPVVALETTLVTHGMPYPENIKTALEVEEIVRSRDVVPATIGVLEGKIRVGMSPSQLTHLAELSRSEGAVKVSRRDLAHTLSQGMSGGTTVAATMMCAHTAGVKVFVTGGLGGVHRGGEKTMDVSADVVELGRTPVAVVCAGVKSILDIQRTLEALETEGVAVATLGNTTEFPAFFTRSSGCKAPFSVGSPAAAAELIDTSLGLGIGSGVVIAVPIPDEHSAEGSEIETAIQQALLSAEAAGIEGKALTPYILQRVNELTEGKSLTANITLIKNNANIGSCIALELAKLQLAHRKGTWSPSNTQASYQGGVGSTCQKRPSHLSSDHRRPVVIGASIFDFIVKITAEEVKSEGTNPGSLHQSFGGVARNVAECMARTGTVPFFISAVGEDANGRSLLNGLRDVGMCLSGVHLSPSLPTATYCVLLNSQGEVMCGVGDMDINSSITPEWVEQFDAQLQGAPLVCFDGNIPARTMGYICDVCHDNHVPVWFEPTGVDKAVTAVKVGILDKFHYVSPNLSELRIIYESVYGTRTSNSPITALSLQQKLAECSALIPPLLDLIPHILVSLGRDGVVWGRMETEKTLSHFSTVGQPTHEEAISVSGAGDSFVGGMMACLSQGVHHEVAIKAGMRAANHSVTTIHSVSPDLTPQQFTQRAILDWAPWKPIKL